VDENVLEGRHRVAEGRRRMRAPWYEGGTYPGVVFLSWRLNRQPPHLPSVSNPKVTGLPSLAVWYSGALGV
jgi:hypothetical protein